MTRAYIVAARRTPVVPRGGALRAIEVADLAATPIRALLADTEFAPADIDDVILGNALYGGGNPARVCLLAAGLPEATSALTVDSQCCAGLDSIILAANRVTSGGAQAVIAGGVESFSRAPIRLRRPDHEGEPARPYDRPPFTPWPERDPDMIAAAAALAVAERLPRSLQEAFAVESHRRALAAVPSQTEIVELAGLVTDTFARPLKEALCQRLPALAGDLEHGVTAATVAVEADAAAVVLVISEDLLARSKSRGRPVRLVGSSRRGGDPERPGLAPIAAARSVLRSHALSPTDVGVAEVMEAFSCQALACIAGVGFHPSRVNRGGGALARGHPIGASGAILAVRLWHELQSESEKTFGLAAIAAAGGLGSALLLAA